MRSQLTLEVGAFGAKVSSSRPDSQFLAWRGQLQYVRLLAPRHGWWCDRRCSWRYGELLPIEQFGIGDSDTVGGYRQDSVLADSGIFGSAELWYPILRTADKKGVLQVTPFVDFGKVWTNSGRRATLEADTLLSAGLGLRWQYGERLNDRGGGGIPSIDLKSSDRSLQERGLYLYTIQTFLGKQPFCPWRN